MDSVRIHEPGVEGEVMGFWDELRDSLQATREKRERERDAFYSREWTAEQARLELNKIRRRLENYDPKVAAEETELTPIFAEAFLSPILSPFMDLGDLLTKEDLHQREDFLKERLKTLTAPQLPTAPRSKREEQFDAALEDDRRDRRWKARMAFGRVHDLRALRKEYEEQQEEIKRRSLSPDQREEELAVLEEDYDEQKQKIKSGSKRDIFEP